MNIKRLHIKIASIAFLIFAFISLLSSFSKTRSLTQQDEFIRWLRNLETNSNDTKDFSHIVLSLRSNNGQLKWQMSLSSEIGREKLLRLLNLARDGEIFVNVNKEEQDYIFSIVDSNIRFEGGFSKDDMRNRSQIGVMVKLFQVFSKTTKK